MSLMCNFTSLKTIADSAGLRVQAFCLREKKGEARENRKIILFYYFKSAAKQSDNQSSGFEITRFSATSFKCLP